MSDAKPSGPLCGIRIIEIAGIGPTQLTGMLLADMGAEIVRVERLEKADLGIAMPARINLMNRSRRSIAIDLKSPAGRDAILKILGRADAIFEGFRPGAMEKLGLGPDDCLRQNPKLVYGRMTGWGQDGPLANTVGHDPNYLAIAGVLGCIGQPDQPPAQPLNLVGDFGGGALYLAMGMLAALLHAQRSGEGQIVDAAMVDGAASMMTWIHGLRSVGAWNETRGTNAIDGGSHYVASYRTADDQYVTVAAIEKRFYLALLEGLSVSRMSVLSASARNKLAGRNSNNGSRKFSPVRHALSGWTFLLTRMPAYLPFSVFPNPSKIRI